MDIRKRLKFQFVLSVVLVIGLSLVGGNLLAAAVNLVLVLVAFLGGLAVGAQYFFPMKGLQVRRQAFCLLWSWMSGTHRPSYVIRDGKAEERLEGDAFSYFGTGVILVDSSTAVALFDGLSASRIVGPGAGITQSEGARSDSGSSVFFTNLYERVRGIIDLRWQLRTKHVQAYTRDGIDLKIELSVNFTIERAPQKEHRARPYTYADRAVYQAVYREGICEGRDDKYDWAEAVLTLAEDSLRHVVAQHTLDQLFALEQQDDPYVGIESQVSEDLRAQVATNGVCLTGVTLGLIHVPDAVVAQRLDSWRVAWESRKAIIEAQAENEAKRREELARALAQTEMIQSIVQSLQGMEEAPAHDVITLRLVEALERMSREPLTRERLSDGARDALSAVTPRRSGDGKR